MTLRDTAPLLYAALLAAVFWLSWLVIQPFILGIVWAMVLVVTFRPLHDRLTTAFRGRAWLASTLVTLLVAAFIVVPIVIAAVQVVQGAIALYGWTQTAYRAGGTDLGALERWPWVGDAVARAKELIGLSNVDLEAAGLDFAKKAGAFAAAKAPGLVGGALGLVFSFLVMLVMLVVLFADGPRFAAAVSSALPVPRHDAERILHDLGVMTRSVFVSVGATALVQALLAGIALLLLGVDHAFTLTAAMFFCAILPGGTGIVWFPVTLYLLATGHPWKAAILAAWCVGVVSTIDNVLRPFFARGGVKLPMALLVFGMLGGLIAFGMVGLFLGPIVLYLLGELIGILRREVYGEATE